MPGSARATRSYAHEEQVARTKVAADRAACEQELRALVSRLQRLLADVPVIPVEPAAPARGEDDDEDEDGYLKLKRDYNDAVRAAVAHKTKLAETRARIEELTTNKTTRRMRSPAEWQAWAQRREQ